MSANSVSIRARTVIEVLLPLLTAPDARRIASQLPVAPWNPNGKGMKRSALTRYRIRRGVRRSLARSRAAKRAREASEKEQVK